MCNFNSEVCAIVLTMTNMLEVEIISHKSHENSTPIGITSFKFSHEYDSKKKLKDFEGICLGKIFIIKVL